MKKYYYVILVLLIINIAGLGFIIFTKNNNSSEILINEELISSIKQIVVESSQEATIATISGLKEIEPEIIDVPNEYVELSNNSLTAARIENDEELKKLYYLNAINYDSTDTEPIIEYLDYLQASDGTEQDYINLASLLNISILETPTENIKELYSIYKDMNEVILQKYFSEPVSEDFLQSESNSKKLFKVDYYDFVSIENKSISKEAIQTYYEKLVNSYNAITNPSDLEENRINSCTTAYEIIQSAYAMINFSKSILLIDDISMLSTSVANLTDQYASFEQYLSYYNSKSDAVLTSFIETLKSQVTTEYSNVQAKQRDATLSLLNTEEEKLRSYLKRYYNKKSDELNEIMNFQLLVGQYQGLFTDSIYLKEMGRLFLFCQKEANRISTERLNDYQYWAYEAIKKAELIIEEEKKNKDKELVLQALIDTGFFSINSENLIEQVHILYGETNSAVKALFREDEDKESLSIVISNNLKAGLKKLEDFE